MLTATLALTLSLTAPVQADPPKITLRMPDTAVTAGSMVRASIELEFAPGLHGYQNPPSEDYMIPVSIEVSEESPLAGAWIAYPRGKEAIAGGETKPVLTYSGKVSIPVTFRAGATAGKQTVSFVVGYQQCNETTCFAPSRKTMTAEFDVVTADGTATRRMGADLARLARQVAQ